MPASVKRKTEATADDSAKKRRKEKIDPKTVCDEMKRQNPTVKRQINFATCMKCIGEGYNYLNYLSRSHPKERTLYNTFESILEHTVSFARDGRRDSIRRAPTAIRVEVGDKKGVLLFKMTCPDIMLTFDVFRYLAVKELKFRDKTRFTCCIGINDNETCDKNIVKGVSSKSSFELLIEHQKMYTMWNTVLSFLNRIMRLKIKTQKMTMKIKYQKVTL